METIVMPFGLGSKTYCPACSEHRERELEKQEAISAQLRKDKALQDQAKKNLERCNIGSRFIGMTFGDYRPTCDRSIKVLSYCQRYASQFNGKSGSNLLMIGSPGTGKNMLAAIICQYVIKSGYTAMHTTALKLVRRIKDSWKNNEESEQGIIDLFVTPELLVIDEIGVQFVSLTEQLYLTEVINERYERKRPTVLISNLKLSQLVETMGERVIDRFYDDGSMILVFDWESYRRRAKDN